MNKNIIDTINESAELALGTSAMESKMEEASAILEYMPAAALNPVIGMNPTPIYTTGELEKLAFCDDPKFNKYGIEATNKELAKKFKDTFATFYSGIMPENIDEVREQWVDAVVAEQKQLGGDDDKVHRQNIVALGWHPDFDILEADWSALNQITTNKIMEEYQYDGSSIIDICEFVKLADGETKKSKKSSPRKRNLNPVYITLISGQKQAISSSLIRWWTKGPFCHAAIGFRHTLDDLKSYNTAKYNGLSDESLEFFTPEERIAVYTIFVEDEDMKAIKRNLDYYIDNRDKTTYSRLNIASIVLGVPLNFQFDMVCSQFVDRILKFAKIDITGKDSSLVSPNDFWKASKNNKKMYKVYDGKVGDYKPNKVKAAIDRLLASSRTKTIKECVEYLLEAKATYSRPYTRDEIRDAYGDGKLTELMGDPAHEWRADTGIELIHPEPTEKELDRIWVNWNAMTPEQKKASDKKCKEIFNKSNTQLYAELKAVWKYKRERGEIEEGASFADLMHRHIVNVIKDPAIENGTKYYECIMSSNEDCEYIDYVPLFPVLETKEFPVQFDEDGNLTIKNYRKLDYNREYQLSHQAIKADMKANQIESLKYELSKLWFLNTVILVKIHDEKIKEEEKAELTKIRAWILNDFNTGLKFVTEREPKFNFSKYYEDSPYSDVRIKINAHTIRGVVDLIKYIVK